MNDRTIRIFSTVEKLANHSAEFLKKTLDESLEQSSYSIALSGGSTPKNIFKFISCNYADKINWEKVTVFFGDERCVPPNDEESNYRMFKQSFLQKVIFPKENVFRVRGEDDETKEAKRYSQVIQQNVNYSNSLPQFDLIMLGLGEDGHTASIFPNQMELMQSPNICMVAVHPNSGQKRITLTGNVINNAKLVVFFVTGKAKAEMVANILTREPNKEYPAANISPKDGKLIWMLDKDAADLLDKKIIEYCFIS